MIKRSRARRKRDFGEWAFRFIQNSLIGISTVVLPFASASARAAGLEDRNLAREGKSLKAVCGGCHNLQVVSDTPMSYDDWHDTVQKMIDRGAKGSDEQLDDIMDYLHRTLTTINVNTADEEELKIVLNVPETVAARIIKRRTTQRFVDLVDLKSIRGINASAIDSRSRLIFFK